MNARQIKVLKELDQLNRGFVGASTSVKASTSKNVAALDGGQYEYDDAIELIAKRFKAVGKLDYFDDSGRLEGTPQSIADFTMETLSKGAKHFVAIATGLSGPHYDFSYGAVLAFTNATAADVQKFIDNGYKD